MQTALTIFTPSQVSGGESANDRALFASRGDSRGSDFASIIGRFQQGQTESPEDLARRAAEQFVSIALVQPLLKQLRETNQAAPPFAPSQGEKQFQSLMDAEVAQRMVRAAHFPLVDRLAHDMLRKLDRGTPAPAAANRSATPA